MTDGITEAMRDTDDVAPTTKRRWHIAVGRPDGCFNFNLEAETAMRALESVLWRGSFGGAEVNSITITEEGL